MKFISLTPQTLLFKCKNRKELTLTFCRVQEFYEAQNAKLRGKPFDFFKFVEQMLTDGGRIAYFHSWRGFNFPSSVYQEWRRLNPQATPYEAKFIACVEKALPAGQPFYVIAMLENDAGTLDHEIAHAMFFLNREYRAAASSLVRRLPKALREQMGRALRDLGYARGVVVDEINAFLATSSDTYLFKRLKLQPGADLGPKAAFKAAFRRYQQQR
jgi:hypothetical protein